MKMTKENKVRILENFQTIDRLLFGKPSKNLIGCCPALMLEYTNTKGALLSVIIEMMKVTNYQAPLIKKKVTSKLLTESSIFVANKIKKATKKVMIGKKMKSHLKESLMKQIKKHQISNLSEDIKQQVESKTMSVALDNLLIGRMLKESCDYSKFNKMEGRILQEAYITVRDALVECAVDLKVMADNAR